MTYWCEYYNCCPCCDQSDDWHITEGKHYHEEPCDGAR